MSFLSKVGETLICLFEFVASETIKKNEEAIKEGNQKINRAYNSERFQTDSEFAHKVQQAEKELNRRSKMLEEVEAKAETYNEKMEQLKSKIR